MTPEQARAGFGIPILMQDVQALVAQGRSQDEAIELVAERCELRSEAVEVLRIALKPGADHAGNR